MRADSRDIIKRIPDNSVDFILTDPPYNLGQHSTGNIPLPGRSAMNNDVAEWDMIDFVPEDWADEFIRILKPTGNLFIFTSYNQLGRWYNCLDHKFDTSNFMIWHKTNPAPKIFKETCEINWQQSAKQVYDFIRGLSPIPGAWTTLVASDDKETVLKIYKSSKSEVKKPSAAPGTIVVESKSLFVACLDGELLQLEEIQLAGKKRMQARDFLNGNQSLKKMK